LLGDREFIGEDWFHWLVESGVKFVIRIKDNSLLGDDKQTRKAIKSFRTLPRNNVRSIIRTLWGLKLFIVGYKNAKGQVCILATNINPEKAAELYAVRWQIESMFLCLKSNGFNLEDTRMCDANKLNVLFGLLAILTCWNCKLGKYYARIKPIKIKNHQRHAENLFHYGMTIALSIFNNISEYKKDFRKIKRVLKNPFNDILNFQNMELQCL